MRTTIIRASEGRMRELLDEPDGVHAFMEDPAYPEVNVDKAWHAIHFALTGTLWGGEGLAAFLQEGGTPVGDVDVGYGPTRAFFPDDVAEIERLVSELSEDSFRTAMKRDEARDLHGTGGRAFDEESFKHELRDLTELKSFLRESLGSAILVVLS